MAQMHHRFRLRNLIAEWERKNNMRLSMVRLSEVTKIAPGTLSKICDPKGYVTNTRYIEELCRFFGVTPNDLFEFVPEIDPKGHQETLPVENTKAE